MKKTIEAAARRASGPKRLRLVLFDIDGTLVKTHGAGRDAFGVAFAEVFGIRPDLDRVRFAGGTDVDLFRRLAAEAGLRPGPAEERAFFERLPHALQHLLAARGGAESLPGTQILLDAIVADPTLLPGLVTGNIAECARIKLEACGINHSFFVGAFGRTHADRARIAAMAIEQARSLVADNGELEAIFLVGDTVRDMAAGKAVGAIPIGVLSGADDTESLQAAGAVQVFRDLSPTQEIMAVLRGALPDGN